MHKRCQRTQVIEEIVKPHWDVSRNWKLNRHFRVTLWCHHKFLEHIIAGCGYLLFVLQPYLKEQRSTEGPVGRMLCGSLDICLDLSCVRVNVRSVYLAPQRESKWDLYCGFILIDYCAFFFSSYWNGYVFVYMDTHTLSADHCVLSNYNPF